MQNLMIKQFHNEKSGALMHQPRFSFISELESYANTF